MKAAADANAEAMMAAHGITEEMVQAALEADLLPPLEQRLLRADMGTVKPSAWLDDLVPVALERILRIVPPRWLDEQSKIGGGLESTYLTEPLCIVASRRLRPGPVPQRFARMVLSAHNSMERRPDFDFWDGAMLVPEFVAFARALDLIPELGAVASTKLGLLPNLSDRDVASTVYELLVGVACLRAGLTVELTEENRSGKTADMRLTDFPVPARIEVKRKIGVSQYDAREAEVMKGLLRRSVEATDAPFRCDLDFVVPPEHLDPHAVVDALVEILSSDSTCTHQAAWGRIHVRRLKRVTTLPRTRLYSPEYLEHVFGWSEDQTAFDGLVARVDPPTRLLVDSSWSPQGIAWRNMIDPFPPAKARGLRSLLADAARQIPAGEMGFVYLAYEEGARVEIADARTAQVLDELRSFHHEWGAVLGGCLIHRLYPRPLREGRPDLIENVVYAYPESGDPDVVRDLPAHIFVPMSTDYAGQ